MPPESPLEERKLKELKPMLSKNPLDQNEKDTGLL